MAKTVASIRWSVVASVDTATYRRLLALRDLHGVQLADLVAYLISVGLTLSYEDLRVLAPSDVSRIVN